MQTSPFEYVPARRERLACLPLKVVQSVEERQPACEPDAVWQPSEPEEPTCTKEPVRGDAGVRVEVATSPNKAGVALLEVQYAIPPAVS